MKHTCTYNHQSQFIEMFGNPISNDRNWDYECINSVAPESPAAHVDDDQVWLLNLDMIESNTGNIIEKVVVPKSDVLSAQPFDEGNVLFSKLRPYLNKVVFPKDKGYATTELVPLRPNQNKLNMVFFTYLLRSDQFVQFANDISGGTKMPRMPLKELREFKCILPPICLQEKFAAIVRQADKSKFGGFKSQFIEMFGNPFDKCSGKVPLSSLCIINPSRPKDLDDSLPVSFIPMEKISEEGEYSTFTIRPLGEVKKGFTYCADEDVLFAKITPCMENGKGAMLKELSNGIGYGSTEFHVLRPLPGITTSTWLYSLTKLDILRKDAAKNMTGTGGQKRVPASYLENFSVLPPSIDLQDEFSSIVRQADKSKYYVENKLNYICHILTNQIQLRRCS